MSSSIRSGIWPAGKNLAPAYANCWDMLMCDKNVCVGGLILNLQSSPCYLINISNKMQVLILFYAKLYC